MPISLRFVVPLALALAAIAYAIVPVVDRLTFQWFVRDLDQRGSLIAKTAQEPLAELMREPRGAKTRVVRYFEKIIQGERIFALGYCDAAGKLLYATATFPAAVRCGQGPVTEERNLVRQVERIRELGLKPSKSLPGHLLESAESESEAEVRALPASKTS